METNNPFAADALRAVLPTLWISATLTQTVAEALTMQPLVTVEGVPSLPTDQQAVQQVALSAISTSARVIGLSSLSLGYANKMTALFPYFQENATLIDDPATDPDTRGEAINNVVAGIDNLLRAIHTDQMQLQLVSNALATVVEAALPAQQAIQADMVATQQILADGDIPALEAQLDTIQQAIDADNKTIAKGTMHDVVDAVKMAIGVYKMGQEELKDGLQSLIGAVECMGSTSNAIQQAMVDVNTQIALYVETLEQLTADELTWAVLQNLGTNTDLMVQYLTTATEAVQADNAAWQRQADELQALANTLNDSASQQPILTNYLTDEVASGWTELAAQAIRQQTILTTHVITPSGISA